MHRVLLGFAELFRPTSSHDSRNARRRVEHARSEPEVVNLEGASTSFASTSDDSLNALHYISPGGRKRARARRSPQVMSAQNLEPRQGTSVTQQPTKPRERTHESGNLLRPRRRGSSASVLKEGTVLMPPPGSTFKTSGTTRNKSAINGPVRPRNDLGKPAGAVSIPVKTSSGEYAQSHGRRSPYFSPVDEAGQPLRKRARISQADDDFGSARGFLNTTADYKQTQALPHTTQSLQRKYTLEPSFTQRLTFAEETLDRKSRAGKRNHSVTDEIMDPHENDFLPEYQANDNDLSLKAALRAVNSLSGGSEETSRTQMSLSSGFRTTEGLSRGVTRRSESPDPLVTTSPQQYTKTQAFSNRNVNSDLAQSSPAQSMSKTSFPVRMLVWNGAFVREPDLSLVRLAKPYQYRLHGGSHSVSSIVFDARDYKEVYVARGSRIVLLRRLDANEFDVLSFPKESQDLWIRFVNNFQKYTRSKAEFMEKSLLLNLAQNQIADSTEQPEGIFYSDLEHGRRSKPAVLETAAPANDVLPPLKLKDRLQAQGENTSRYVTGGIDEILRRSKKRSDELSAPPAHSRVGIVSSFVTPSHRNSFHISPLRRNRSPETPAPLDGRLRRTSRRSTRNNETARSADDQEESRLSDEVQVYEKYSQTHGLGPRWAFPLTYPPTGKNKATIEYDDLERLDEGEFLNDNIIDFYVRFLANKQPDLADRMYCFNTYFYTALTQGKATGKIFYENVQKWTRNVDLFSKDFIIVPVNEDYHWYLAIICNLPNLTRRLERGDEDENGRESLPGIDEERPRPRAGNEVVLDGSVPIQELLLSETSPPRTLKNENISDQAVPNSDPASDMAVDVQASLAQNQGPRQPSMASTNNESGSVIEVAKKRRRSGRIIDPSVPAIITLDSLGIKHPSTVKALKNYIVEEGKNKRSLAIDSKEISGVTARNIPTQSNWCDCGLYLLLYFGKFLEDPDRNMSKILQQDFDLDQDWPSTDASEMRHTIRSILLDLYKQQEGGNYQSDEPQPVDVDMVNPATDLFPPSEGALHQDGLGEDGAIHPTIETTFEHTAGSETEYMTSAPRLQAASERPFASDRFQDLVAKNDLEHDLEDLRMERNSDDGLDDTQDQQPASNRFPNGSRLSVVVPPIPVENVNDEFEARSHHAERRADLSSESKQEVEADDRTFVAEAREKAGAQEWRQIPRRRRSPPKRAIPPLSAFERPQAIRKSDVNEVIEILD